MAIRLRRIENTAQKQKESVADIEHKVKQKSILWKRVRFFSLSLSLFFLVLYIIFFDSSIASGIVIVKSKSVNLKTLSPGTISWIIKPKHNSHIKKGTILAKIILQVPEILEEKKRLHQKQLELESYKLSEINMKEKLAEQLKLITQQDYSINYLKMTLKKDY